MIVYKVVRNKNGKLKSAIPRSNYPRAKVRREYAQLTYCPGKTTKPKFGKIFAFSNLADAQSWIDYLLVKGREIWEAETPEAEPIEEIASDASWGIDVLNLFKDFWAKGAVYFERMPAPAGTVVCPQLSLRRRCDNAPVKNRP